MTKHTVSNTEGEHTCLLKDYDNFLTLSKICKMCYDNDEDLLSPSTSSICKDLTCVSGQVPITLRVSDSKEESPVVRRVLVQGVFPIRGRQEDRGGRVQDKADDG